MVTDRCIHHDRCRADHARGDMLCGWHHAKAWNFCIWHRGYESQARLAKAQESAAAKDDTIVKGNEMISETISREAEPA